MTEKAIELLIHLLASANTELIGVLRLYVVLAFLHKITVCAAWTAIFGIIGATIYRSVKVATP